MSKRITIFCLLLVITLASLSSNSGEDIEDVQPIQTPPVQNDQNNPYDYEVEESGGLLEGVATSDGFFSLSYKPDFIVGKVMLQLDVNLKGQVTFDPLDVTFDFTDYKIPPREQQMPLSDYSQILLKHITRFVRTIQYGQRYDSVYIRFGKLLGITLGDGALINGYFEHSLSTRPGLDVMIDGSLLNIPYAGFEYITNDIFDPTLEAWRIFSRPMYDYTVYPRISKLQFGLSYAGTPKQDNPEEPLPMEKKLLAFDISYPLIHNRFINIDLFSDLILQFPDIHTSQPGVASRHGIWGHSGEFFVFNSSVTIPKFGVYYSDYYASGFEKRTVEELEKSQIQLGSSRIDSMFSFNFSKLGLYLRTRMSSTYTDGTYHDYRFSVQGKIDKRLFNIVSLDLSYEKLYPTSTGETFIEGLRTLKNVEVTSTAIVKIKPYTFDIGLGIHFDEYGEPTYQLDTLVRITIL